MKNNINFIPNESINLKGTLKHLLSCLIGQEKDVIGKETNKGYSFSKGKKRVHVVLGVGDKTNISGNTVFVANKDTLRYNMIKEKVNGLLDGNIKPQYTDKQKLRYFEQKAQYFEGKDKKKHQYYKNKYINQLKKVENKNENKNKGFTSFGSFIKKDNEVKKSKKELMQEYENSLDFALLKDVIDQDSLIDKIFNSPIVDGEDLETLIKINKKRVKYLGADSKQFKKYDDMYNNTLRFLDQKYFSN